jgi:methylated-DNA-protein-cysteine methyltransferase-like protein
VEGVPSLPWHRVINAQGRISLPPNTESHKEQKRRLRGEGVRFVGGKVDLDKFGWRPRSESPLLD